MLPWKNMKTSVFAVVGPLLVIPFFVSAQLVPCLGPECQACHLIGLAQNVINFLIGISAVIGALLFGWAGFLMVTAGGKSSQIEKAKGIFTNVVIGFIVMLAAWLIIDTVMKLLTNQGGRLGVWNTIECVTLPGYDDGAMLVEPDFMNPKPGESRGTASNLSQSTMSQEQLDALAAGGASYDQMVCAAATGSGIGSECASLKALIRVESSGCVNKVSPAGAYGCMQILPSTAKLYDPSIANWSNQAIADRLKNDDAYNINLGVAIYKDAYAKYGGNRDKIYAAYNGGFGANESSSNCPGQLRWQCEWDNDEHTDPNEGYVETRNYVRNINNLRGQLD